MSRATKNLDLSFLAVRAKRRYICCSQEHHCSGIADRSRKVVERESIQEIPVTASAWLSGLYLRMLSLLSKGTAGVWRAGGGGAGVTDL
ncbi:MAG: hypothetical protein IPI63_11830 [Methanothrix sp.]|uniref:hypothetical protein n=1 Tax=Methanothrix sp. TaxID=90426 RepID=UPI0025E2DD71|nr:hypothetical protein [Methanothrix sp.]MBK7387349.1 hypothetical protein [Methanothrix sp.]